MIYICYLIAAFLLFGLANLLHESLNRGLSSDSRHQQGTRFAVASLMAVVPLAITGQEPAGTRLLLIAITVIAWMLTYPALFHISNRKSSPDYDNYMDTACGYYFLGALTALAVAGSSLGNAAYIISGIILSATEIILTLTCLAQLVYFALYKKCIDNDGMIIIGQTDANEVIEFSRSYTWWVSALIIIAIMALSAACTTLNFMPQQAMPTVPGWLGIIEAIIFTALCIFIFRGKRCPFKRCGIISLYLDVREYSRTNTEYKECRSRRLKDMTVEQQGKPWDKPTTIVMVIGESATRDYMSAFTPMEQDTTPWMRTSVRNDPKHFLIFPNTYSCALYTIASLEKALTEFNQYNGKNFNDACTIIDMAHALGYRVHWYSNQGHLGAFDTHVTLMAETADVAKWTKQHLNKVQYDMSLLDYIDELDPTVNNLLILHLMGSHFNFLNRYPEDQTVWGQPGVQDNELNYMNSLHYTDTVLHNIYDICREKLNMQAMVYFSDHGQAPKQRRTPSFQGFTGTRIPMFVWLGDDYISHHPQPYNELKNNRERYFTNDLVYNLMCGLMDLKSDHYEETDSLTSPSYRHTIDTLTTDEGRVPLTDDPTIAKRQ